MEKVCDQINDCSDSSDESGLCSLYKNNTDCKANACPSNAKCRISPKGPVCVCPSGYRFNFESRKCEV